MSAPSISISTQCSSPVLIKNPNLGKHPSKFRNVTSPYITVPCGKCPECLTKKRNDLINRMKLEASASSNNYFFTLTYDELHIPTVAETYPEEQVQGELAAIHCVNKSHVQAFLQSVRNSLRSCSDYTGLRYVVASEYGPQGLRPHYHGVFFNFPESAEVHSTIARSWPFGFTSVGPLTLGGVGYVGKYIFKKGEIPVPSLGGFFRNFCLFSYKPPIGFAGLTKRQIDYLFENKTRFLRLNGELIQVPYVLLRQYLTPTQINIIKLQEKLYAQNKLDALFDRADHSSNSKTNPFKSDVDSRRENTSYLLGRLNHSKKQSKDI